MASGAAMKQATTSTGISTGTGTMGSAARAVALCCIALGLLLRIIVPAGWMPAAGDGLLITLCTDVGPVQVWMDADGKVHKQPAGQKQAQDHPCDFAPFSSSLLHVAIQPLTAPQPKPDRVQPIGLAEVHIGRGLAAPPPPSTGPPVRL